MWLSEGSLLLYPVYGIFVAGVRSVVVVKSVSLADAVKTFATPALGL